MSALGYLGVGYALVWLVLAAYLFSIARRQKALQARIDDLEHGGK